MQRKRKKLARQKKFLVDAMLFKLGRWLRILGYDCKIPESDEMDDDRLVEISKKEKRLLITMDRDLSKRKGAHTIYIPSKFNSAKSQLIFLLKNKIIKISKSRNLGSAIEKKAKCTKCGSDLKKISRRELEKIVGQSRIPSGQDSFWICKNCGQIYWKGSHWKKIVEFVKSLKKK